MSRARDVADIHDGSTDITTLGTVTTGTIGSGVTFPAGHIIQAVDATYSNFDSTAQTASAGTHTAVADWTGGITITSGNAVLIYFLADMRITGNTDCFGGAQLCEGTVSLPSTVLTQVNAGHSSATFSNFTAQGWALDTSPASTQPSYCVKIGRGSAGTTSVALRSASSTRLKLMLFEVQQ